MYEEYKQFSRAEFQARWLRARQLMDEAKIDALLLSGDTNFTYFTGAENTFCYTRPLLVLIPARGDPVALASHVYRDGVCRTGWVEDVRGHGVLGAPIDLLCEVVAELELQRSTIAIELGQNTRLGMTVAELLEIERRLPSVTWVDASEVIQTLRMIKSTAELEAHRRACWITSKMFGKVPDVLRQGMTEAEAARILTTLLTEEGGFTPFVYIKSGPDPTLPAGSSGRYPVRNTTRVMKTGYLLIDAGTCYQGYWSDFGRHFWIGHPPPEAERYHEVDAHMLAAAVAQIKPGTRPAKLVQASFDVLAHSGLQDLTVNSAGRIGHGLGLDHCERPDINEEYSRPLEPGNFFALEPHCRSKLGWWVLEHNVAVTEVGYDIFSRAPIELQTI